MWVALRVTVSTEVGVLLAGERYEVPRALGVRLVTGGHAIRLTLAANLVCLN